MRFLSKIMLTVYPCNNTWDTEELQDMDDFLLVNTFPLEKK